MFVIKNGDDFYIQVGNAKKITKTKEFEEATKFKTTEAAQMIMDIAKGKTKSYRIYDIDKEIVYPKGRTRIIYTKRERELVYHNADCRCQLCGRKIKYSEMTLDHIIPLAMGGEDRLENIQASCEECNKHKAALLPEDYFDKVNRTFIYQMNKRYEKNILWKISKLFIWKLEQSM